MLPIKSGIAGFLNERVLCQAIDTIIGAWSAHLEVLKQFHATRAEFPAQSQKNVATKLSIGKWLRRQVDDCRRGTLSKDRQECLDAISPAWRWCARFRFAEIA